MKQYHLRVLVLLVTFIFSASCLKNEKELPEEASGGIAPSRAQPEKPAPVPVLAPVVPLPEINPELIIGNFFNESTQEGEDSEGYEESGDWAQSSMSGYDGSVVRESDDDGAEVLYERDKIIEGKYCISVYRVTHKEGATKARFEVFDGDEKKARKTLSFSSKKSKEGWVDLGAFDFTGNSEARVELERDKKSKGTYLYADEVRFYLLGDDEDCSVVK